jgi:hypothetical protein
MTARTAPYWPQTYTGDGTTSNFALGFAILDNAHLRVVVAGVLKTLGTDYIVTDSAPVTPALYTSHIPGADTSVKHVQFLTGKIPANSASIKFYRNTPIARPSPSKKVEIGPDVALYAHFRQQERDDNLVLLPFAFTQTALLAGTAQALVAPCDGYIASLETDVTVAVTTGGNIGATIEPSGANQAVTGMVATIANSAAVGAQQVVNPTTAQASYTVVKKGQAINITAASFATAGALRGVLAIQPADLS